MQYADDYSSYGNEVLYRMCRDRLLHTDIDTIKSKLWIIGRSYSAAIERKAGKNFDLNIAAALIRDSAIDLHISKLRTVDRLTLENIDILLDAHKCLVHQLKESTGIEKRSLASKYLHFHAPNAVFLFDSKANKKIREILIPHKQKFALKREHDDLYEKFVRRCIYFRDVIYENEIKAKASPRKIDMYLLEY